RVSCDPGQSQHRQAAWHPGRPAPALRKTLWNCAVLATVRGGKRSSGAANLYRDNPSVPDGERGVGGVYAGARYGGLLSRPAVFSRYRVAPVAGGWQIIAGTLLQTSRNCTMIGFTNNMKN